MTKQHKALELAKYHDDSAAYTESIGFLASPERDTAAELRRLHALVVQMREALEKTTVLHDPMRLEALTAATQYLEQP